jgi:hypothetical protein
MTKNRDYLVPTQAQINAMKLRSKNFSAPMLESNFSVTVRHAVTGLDPGAERLLLGTFRTVIYADFERLPFTYTS